MQVEREELVAGVEAGPALGAERDLELLAEEQVLEENALAPAKGASKGGQEEPEEFDHPGQDRASSRSALGSVQTSAPYSRTLARRR